MVLKNWLCLAGWHLAIVIGTLVGLLVLGVFWFFPSQALIDLAGGLGEGAGGTVFMFWPLALLIAFITLIVDYMRKYGPDYHPPFATWRFWRPGRVTLIWLGYYLLPIAFNGMSSVCRAVGWQTASEIIFACRWWSHFLLPVTVLTMMMLWAGLMTVRGLSSKSAPRDHDCLR